MAARFFLLIPHPAHQRLPHSIIGCRRGAARRGGLLQDKMAEDEGIGALTMGRMSRHGD